MRLHAIFILPCFLFQRGRFIGAPEEVVSTTSSTKTKPKIKEGVVGFEVVGWVFCAGGLWRRWGVGSIGTSSDLWDERVKRGRN